MKYEDFLAKVNRWLKKSDIAGAVAECERLLQKLPESPFHKAVGRDWLKQQTKLATWFKKQYAAASKQFAVKALYVEMNRFEINTDSWYLDAFAFDDFGGTQDVEWLCNSKYTSDDEDQFVLTGMKDLQKTFAAVMTTESTAPEAENAAILLLTLRMLEVVQAAVVEARANGSIPEDVPLFAAAHEAEPIQCFYGATKPKKKAAPKVKFPVISADPPAPGWRGIYEPNTSSPDGNGYPFDCLNHVSYVNGGAGAYDSKAERVQAAIIDDACMASGSVLKTWAAPTELAVRQRKKGWTGDIYHAGCEGWAVNDRAKAILEPIFGKHAEFLPLKPTNADLLWVLHPLRKIKAPPNSCRLNYHGCRRIHLTSTWSPNFPFLSSAAKTKTEMYLRSFASLRT